MQKGSISRENYSLLGGKLSLSECHPRQQPSPFSDFYNKDWANKKLCFAIASLQGKVESSIWKRRLQSALIVRDELLEHGYKWQASRIDNWIHRLQGQEKAKDEARIQASGAQDPTVPGPGKVSQANRPDLRERREEASF